MLDPLTGMANRAALNRLISSPEGARELVGGWLAVIDLDRFKPINDRYGHAVGDDVLRDVAHILTETPGTTLAARLGGDEFVLLVEPRSEGEARLVCSQVRNRVCELLGRYRVDLSIGLAAVARQHGLGDALIRADEALYVRKRIGGSGITTATR